MAITIKQGATFRIDLLQSGFDFPGRTFRAQLRRSHGGELLATFGFPIIEEGRIRLQLEESQTTPLPATDGNTKYVMDVEMVTPLSNAPEPDVRRIFESQDVKVSPEVTT